MRTVVWLFLISTLGIGIQCSPYSSLEQVDVFVSGTEGYDTFRIPVLLPLPDSTLLAFCEGRKDDRGDAGNIDMVMKKSVDGGRTWSDLQVVWNDMDNTCGNPCAVLDETTGVIWLLMTHNLGEDHEAEIIKGTSVGTRTVWVSSSRDLGMTWTPPQNITNTAKRTDWTWYATGPGIGIQLQTLPHSERLVIPCDHKTSGPEVTYHSHVIYSDDHGQNWTIGGTTPHGFNECQVVELSDGRLMLNMRRSRQNKTIYRGIAYSADGGGSWTDVGYDSTLISPRCQASLMRYPHPDGKRDWLFFSNPADPTDRIRMTVRYSPDGGQSWPRQVLLHAGPSAYSCLAPLPDDAVACLYERGDVPADDRTPGNPYERITFARMTLDSFLR